MEIINIYQSMYRGPNSESNASEFLEYISFWQLLPMSHRQIAVCTLS